MTEGEGFEVVDLVVAVEGLKVVVLGCFHAVVGTFAPNVLVGARDVVVETAKEHPLPRGHLDPKGE